MSKLVKAVYDVARIRGRYLRVHDAIFHLSARKLVRVLNLGRPKDAHGSGTTELEQLLQRLQIAQTELENLDESDLSVRRGREIQTELADYVSALTESVQILKSISEHLRQRDTKSELYDPERLQGLKVDYDDAMQHHKRLGARLNTLIATL